MPKARQIYTVQGVDSEPREGGKAAREVGRRVITEALVRRTSAAVAGRVERLRETLAARGVLPDDAPDAASVVAAFEASYARRPLRDNAGGTMRNSSTWIFAVAALLRPSTIVECGTFKGHSSWLMAEAAPEARIITFDVMREDGRLRDKRVEYRLGDWSDAADLETLPDGTLCVFDDHISHRLRLEQAKARGAKLALVDDDYDALTLYATGSPPVPTVAMLTDPDLPAGTCCEWERPGKRYAYTITEADLAAGRELIDWTVPMPDLTVVNRYVAQAPMTLVGLR
ncbi:hypothetical protein T8K17_12860 [Thalassobaculum sp. OXR-137]|uniref:hypothetical protein n=1 Tax=Thalassobaculum sp. OXR-137 TaxID=3100173 RepID=UPI002AC96C6D|nr:hypothetical protein [Thalassobaculum sp. OXR-137]WPZ37017.1 hypothetical protein T8K17_12860 [Thalassobaculum sp. OXR-137]